MESERLRALILFPDGMTMTDLRRAHEELFASEGLDLLAGFEDFVAKAKREGKHEAAEKETASNGSAGPL
jgi:hypothetical protein